MKSIQGMRCEEVKEAGSKIEKAKSKNWKILATLLPEPECGSIKLNRRFS